MNLDIVDLHAYLYRYPVVMFEETGGEPYNGNYESIYTNAITVGLRNGRNVKKGLDVPLKNDTHQLNKGFQTQIVQEEGTGPVDFFELAKFWYTTSLEVSPPLFIKLEVPGDRYFDTIQYLWNDRDTGGDTNWSAFAVRVVKAGYCSVGDVLAEASELVENSIENNDTNTDRTFGFTKAKHLLFAHKSICRECPPLEIVRWDEAENNKTKADPLGWTTSWQAKKWGGYGPRRLYIADVSKEIPENLQKASHNAKRCKYSDLYQPLGVYVGRNLINAKLYKVQYQQDDYDENVKMIVNTVAVLKTALIYAERSTTRTVLDNRDIDDDKGHLYSNPTVLDLDNVIFVDKAYEVISLHKNPKEAFKIIISHLMTQNSDKYDYGKQVLVLNDDLTKKHDFFRGLCSMSPTIVEYPDICACLGKGNEETLMKAKIPKFSFFCHSGICINEAIADGVYKFAQDTTASSCETISLCDVDLEGLPFVDFNDKVKDLNTACTPAAAPPPALVPPAAVVPAAVVPSTALVPAAISGSMFIPCLPWLHVALFAAIAIFVAIVLTFSLTIKK